jgi:hypothetical protein
MASRSLKEKTAMWENDPHCYWCGRLTKIYGNSKDFKLPDDAATIDHVYAGRDPRRLEFKRNKKPSPVVLACLKCNKQRGGRTLEQQEKKFNKTERKFYTTKILREMIRNKK